MPVLPNTTKAILLISLITCSAAIYCQLYNQSLRDAQLRHAVMLQQLQGGLASIAGKAEGLLNGSEELASLKSLSDKNIVTYQTIMNGSIKQDLTAVDTLIPDDIQPFQTSFGQFSDQVAKLIQSRSQLVQLESKREEIILNARVLAEKGADLAVGIHQFGATSDQIAATYELALQLNRHYLSVTQVFSDSGRYRALELGAVSNTLTNISTGPAATQSAILRRSAAQLLSDIESFSQTAAAIEELEQLKQNLNQQLQGIQVARSALSNDIHSLQEAVTSNRSLSFPLALAAWLISVSSALAGCLMAARASATAAAPAPVPVPEPASELTSGYYLSQIKTDKNKLMNDIRPLADGILYLRADEHLESTGDIAKCFNRSREALVEKIDTLRTLVNRLQQAVDTNNETGAGDALGPSLDTAPIEDLTFKAQAGLEGISRKIRRQSIDDTVTRKEVLIQCRQADAILDEIRVRVKKCVKESVPNPLPETTAQMPQPHNVEVKKLITSIVEGLDEFQTQPPAKVRRKAG